MTAPLYDLNAIAAHFNRAATSYEKEAKLQRYYLHQAITYLKTRLPANALVLDAGAGSGMFAKLAKEAGCNWRIIGCDIAMQMCKAAKPHQQASLQCDLSRLPFPHTSFDAVICAFALQWNNAPAETIKTMAKTLKSGTPLLLLSFADGTLEELKQAARAAGAQHIANPFHGLHTYRKWVAAAGLKVEHCSDGKCITSFSDVEALFKHLKFMGASNSLSGRNKSLAGRTELQNIAKTYTEKYITSDGIPATWNIVNIVASKN